MTGSSISPVPQSAGSSIIGLLNNPLPTGFVLNEKPESVRIEPNDVYFNAYCFAKDNAVDFCRVFRRKRNHYTPEEYTFLKESYDKMVSGDQDNDFRVRRQDVFLSTIQQTNAEIARFIIMIAMVSLFVGGIGIANIMLVSVTERVREIGVRRAIGAKRSSILAQFITEAATLGITGGILGILAGLIFNYFQIGAQIIVPWTWIGYSFLICGLVGVMAGMYPAIKAANANVMESLRYE
jgi:ABC-type antimicrobial peptide transport system permease subunit